MRLHTADGGLSPLFVITLSMLDTALVVGLVFLFLRAHGERARDVLLGRRPAWREVAGRRRASPDRVPVALLVLALILTFAPQLHNVPRNPCEDLMRNPRDAAIFGIVVMIAGGVREEMQRGFILHRFSQYLGGGVVGVVVHSALFGLGHVRSGVGRHDCGRNARRHLGYDLPDAAQHHRADGQPRGIQPGAARQVHGAAVGIATGRDHLLDTLSRVLALSRRELLVLVCAFVLSLPAVTPRIYASDEIQYFSYLRSLWFDHDVSFENEYQYFFDRNIGRGEGLSRDVSRAVHRCRTAAELRHDRQRAVVEPVLRRCRSGDARHGRARRMASRVPMWPRSPTVRHSTGFVAILLSIAAARRLAGPGLARRRSSSGSARRCSSTCTCRRPTRTPARRLPSRCSSRSGCTCASAGPSAAPSRSACPAR